MENYIGIREIWQVDRKTLGIVWTDKKEQMFDVANLRSQCPCALCTDEITGKKKIEPTTLDANITPVVIKSIGRYALSIEFSDKHSTGIYTFKMLRQLI